MLEKMITYNFNDNFIDKVAEYITSNCKVDASDYSRTAVIFGGKRPGLFLKRALGKKLKTSFVPPRFFSIDEFVNYIVCKKENIVCIPEIEACYSVYNIAKQKTPKLMKFRERFSEFLPWAREIISFIDQLDTEDIPSERLSAIEKNAEIGYEVPETINALLENIVELRFAYHEKMKKEKKFSRGFFYLNAARNCAEEELPEFDRILFCNFFDLHKTEKQILKHYSDFGKGIIIWQKDQSSWPQFEELSDYFDAEIKPLEYIPAKPMINLYSGFDTHSQVGIVREVLEKIKDREKTVIVLPRAEAIIPLLSEISSCTDDFNVSMGYPVCRSTLYSLFDAIYRAQKTKKKNEYYAKDYLEVLMHPLLKNLIINNDSSETRVLVHKIEELLSGGLDSAIGGSLFISTDSVEDMDRLYELVQEQLQSMGFYPEVGEIKKTLVKIHYYAFTMWEGLNTMGDFSRVLDEFLQVLIEKSALSKFALNTKVITKLYSLSDQFRNQALSQERFAQSELFRIFDDLMKNEKIAFSGMPLKGLQILGLFETRALNFDNVIIMDVNESVLPRLSANEPLVPRQVLISLGLDRLEEEEGIQRYQFMRLINAAKNVHLVYNDSADKEKSRFIEEIIWEQEKKQKAMDIVKIPRAAFNVEVLTKTGFVSKGKNTQELLEKFIFSASSINMYLNCPLQFYYRYVLGLSEKEDLLDELESREVGTFLHELLEDCFKKFINNTPQITPEFRKQVFTEFDNRFKQKFVRRMKSDAFMIEQILRYRLEKFLDNEAERQVFKIEGLEQDIIRDIPLGKRTVCFKCRIDRIDRLDNENILVIDYKTGSTDITPRGLATLEKAMEAPDRQIIKKAIQSFQLPIYLYCVNQQYLNDNITAGLYNLRTLKIDMFPKIKEQGQLNDIMDVCMRALSFIINEIYDLNTPFIADASNDSCRYCPFISLCR